MARGFGVAAALGALLVPAVAHADTPASPALLAKYNPHTSFGADASCFNDPAHMPPGQDQSNCSVSAVSGGVGVTTITMQKGKPFVEWFEAGYATFVTAVGSNALCRESAISFPNSTSPQRQAVLSAGQWIGRTSFEQGTWD